MSIEKNECFALEKLFKNHCVELLERIKEIQKHFYLNYIWEQLKT